MHETEIITEETHFIREKRLNTPLEQLVCPFAISTEVFTEVIVREKEQTLSFNELQDYRGVKT